MKVGALCAGYGGIELGLRLAGVDVDLRWLAEFDPALDVLHGEVPNLGDITRVDWSVVEPIDLLTAGFPCQPVSAAGRQLGDCDSRWLWPWVRDAIETLKPHQVLLENVRNLISTQGGALWRGILSDLVSLGYGVRWLTLGACHVGAAHHRHRVFALATMGGAGVERVATSFCGAKGDAILPTPTAVSYGSNQGGAAGRIGPVRHSLDALARLELLPTPAARDGQGRGTPSVETAGARYASGRRNLDDGLALLPTPTVNDSRGGRNATANRSEGRDHHHAGITLCDVSYGDLWGRFAEAAARHESLYGPAPAPTEPNKNGAPRLAPEFAEWLMCLAPGHVTAKLARVSALRAIGNGVCPPQLAAAWRLLAEPLDVSLGFGVASPLVTISTSQEVKNIQERSAASRARIIDAASSITLSQDYYSDEGQAASIAAAMMELVAVWREDADAIETAKRKGHVTTCKEIRQAASRLAGFAVGLTTRPIAPIESRTDTEREADEQAQVARNAAVVNHAASVAQVLLDAVPVAGTDPIMDFLTGPPGAKYEPAPRPEQILDELKKEAASMMPALVDNPFTNPGAPGRGARPAIQPVPYAAIDGLARKLAADHERDHVSHSYVSSYESCSMSSLLSDASKAGIVGPRRPGWSLIGGSAFHTAVESIERATQAAETLRTGDCEMLWADHLNAAIKIRCEELAGTHYADPSTWHVANGGREGYDWWRVEGAAMVKRYLDHHDAAWRETHLILMVKDVTPAIELPYTMSVRSLDGSTSYEAQGFIDAAWLSLKDFRVTIVDYKSGRSAPSETFQLGEYAHALLMSMGLAEAPEGRPILASYWLARKGVYTEPIDAIAAHPLVELQYRYGAAMRGTQAGIFTPHLTNLCGSCGVRDYCPSQAGR